MPERQRPDFMFYSSFYLAIINKMNHRYDQAIALLRPLVPFAQEKHLRVSVNMCICRVFSAVVRHRST